MQNTVQNRITGISHFFLAVGILILSAYFITLLSNWLGSLIFGLDIDNLRKVSVEELTVKQGYALKFTQLFTPIAVITASVVSAKVFKVKFLDFTGLKNRVNLKFIGLALLVFVPLIPLISWLVTANAQVQFPEAITEVLTELEDTMNNLYSLFLKHNTGHHLVLNIVLMSILPAIAEEVFFRGILMRVMTNWTRNIHIGVIGSSVFFALIHLQPYKFIPMVVMAAVFGYMYYRTGSLWVPIALHALNNSLVLLADWAAKNNITFEMLDSDYDFGIGYIFVGIGIAGISAYLLWKNSQETDFSYE